MTTLGSTTPNMYQPNNYLTTYDSKTKIVILHSLSNALDITLTIQEANLKKILVQIYHPH